MGPFESQLREFIRRLDFVEHEVWGHGRKLTAIRQNLRDADDTGIKAKLARISGEVDGCASAGFPGATVAIYHHATGVKLGELTCDSDGLYAGRVGLDSNPQDVDIVATPTGTYAARFDSPVVTPATLSVGANPVPPIVIPPTADWCCGEVDYFPGDCDLAWTFNVKGCMGTGLAGATIELKQSGVLIDSCVTADGTGGTTLGQCVLTVPGGTYDITITGPSGAGFAVSSSSQSIAAAKTTNTTLTADASHICVSICNYPIPRTLYTTDGLGTHTLVNSGSGWRVTVPVDGALKDTCVLGTPMSAFYSFGVDGLGWSLSIRWVWVCCGDSIETTHSVYFSDAGTPSFGNTATVKSNVVLACPPSFSVNLTVPAFTLLPFVCFADSPTTGGPGHQTPGGGGLMVVTS